MEILIEQIKEDGLVLAFEESAAAFPVLAEMVDNGEWEFSAPIKTTLRAQRLGDMVEIDGDIETSVRLPCSRCLQPFETHLKSHFALTYLQRATDGIEDTDSQEVELNSGDMGIVYFQGDNIDLKYPVQEQVVMAYPLRGLWL